MIDYKKEYVTMLAVKDNIIKQQCAVIEAAEMIINDRNQRINLLEKSLNKYNQHIMMFVDYSLN